MSQYEYTDASGRTLSFIRSVLNKGYVLLQVEHGDTEVFTHVANEDAPTVAAELLKAAGQEGVIVPKAKDEVRTFDSDVLSCGTGVEEALARDYDNPNWLYNRAANYIALAEYIENKVQRETEAATKLQERRDALATELTNGYGDYESAADSMQKAIDRIIELEDGK